MTNKFSFSFKNRIAFNYIVSGSILIAFVFLFIFYIVRLSVNKHINDEIYIELQKHIDDVKIDVHDTYLIQVDQWAAVEHNSVDINPVFVQFFDNNRELIDKSPNLNSLNLKLQSEDQNNAFFNTSLNNEPIRQIQRPIIQNNKIIGYVIVAMSIDDFEIVVILERVLLITFPLILIVLFLIARFFAGRSIKPINLITETANSITKDNLSQRIPLPINKDELHQLSTKINELLDRIESAVEREKKFTSDASHELRTPLAIIKGTLEVLIRKPREKEEYESKINYCITEVDRLNNLVDQLLLLARFENQKHNIKYESVSINALVLDSISRFSKQIKEKNIQIKSIFLKDFYINSDNYLLSIIFSNIISNAIKYSKNEAQINIEVTEVDGKVNCIIEDNGVGINPTDLKNIYNSFYRSNAENHPEIKGNGIGLSIVKRICDLLNISIEISSIENQGTTVKLILS
ncbi:sensor histidine kinase [Flavobacterium sp.]|uniref:sensor histidine kinase n=1 Tax=Flavobacterium sp. TaxID=239 RepID=UPI003D2BC80A